MFMKRQLRITSANVSFLSFFFLHVSLIVFLFILPSTFCLLSDGDLGFQPSAKEVYMKQKHRMIWERRYGKVGSGMTPKEE